jgi:GntR family transcriptional regulator
MLLQGDIYPGNKTKLYHCTETIIEGEQNMEGKQNWEIDRPYYLQLKHILKGRIQAGEMGDGRLPPIRQVAKEFGVSVNTVLRAYGELGKEGIVSGSVGKGTFLTASNLEMKHHNRQLLLRKIVEHALEEALSQEFSIEEFESAVRKYIDEKLEMMQSIKLAFIECNIEQLTYFTDHLELDPHIQRTPILLQDLRAENEETMKKAIQNDIFVTSFYHLKEVQERLGHLGKPITGINIEPEVATLIKIARMPFESSVGIVTTSAQFRKEIRDVLSRLELFFREIHETSEKNGEELKRMVKNCDALLVSPSQKNRVTEYAREGTKIIEFVFTPDRTSINNLKLSILELKNNKS